MFKMMIVIFLVIYIEGYFVSLWVMHRYKKELGIDHYDPPHSIFYDSYSSNAEAYAMMSLIWPIMVIILILSFIWKGLMFISKKLEK
jgi:hypothetical protein